MDMRVKWDTAFTKKKIISSFTRRLNNKWISLMITSEKELRARASFSLWWGYNIERPMYRRRVTGVDGAFPCSSPFPSLRLKLIAQRQTRNRCSFIYRLTFRVGGGSAHAETSVISSTRGLFERVRFTGIIYMYITRRMKTNRRSQSWSSSGESP